MRYLTGEVSDAYLMRSGPLPGYSIVPFRTRHVADPTELTRDELATWWDDIRTAVRAINDVYVPCHINYQILGNSVPHIHAHLIPRYLDDPAPMRRLRDQHWDGAARLTDDELARQLAALREAVARAGHPG
ncbi:MAG: HIT domain-containing protein [Actinobacteria bacterium]|nr:HIT domain-containing protein [Actinomycetota bacterium]